MALVSNSAFVALWFNNGTNHVYREAIEPAINKAGFRPIRIDRKDRANKINDEIIAEIRRIRFMVCELTCWLVPNSDDNCNPFPIAWDSVYYEAGFAHGRGRQAILICRDDLIDLIHFDLRLYVSIVWEEGNEEDLLEALLSQFRVVIV